MGVVAALVALLFAIGPIDAWAWVMVAVLILVYAFLGWCWAKDEAQIKVAVAATQQRQQDKLVKHLEKIEASLEAWRQEEAHHSSAEHRQLIAALSAIRDEVRAAGEKGPVVTELEEVNMLLGGLTARFESPAQDREEALQLGDDSEKP